MLKFHEKNLTDFRDTVNEKLSRIFSSHFSHLILPKFALFCEKKYLAKFNKNLKFFAKKKNMPKIQFSLFFIFFRPVSSERKKITV